MKQGNQVRPIQCKLREQEGKDMDEAMAVKGYRFVADFTRDAIAFYVKSIKKGKK